MRRLGLTGTELARAQAGTIRLKLLKIGAVIWRNTRRIRFCLSSACPDKAILRSAGANATGLRRQCAALIAPATLPCYAPS